MAKLEKATIVIQGKEYNFIKPYACDLIDIEDKSYASGEFNNFEYMSGVLKLVSQKLNAEDLVIANLEPAILTNGTALPVVDIGYKKYISLVNELRPVTRTKAAKEVLKMAGVSGEINLSAYSYEDLNIMASAFYNLYDDSDLEKVVEEIATFCFPKEA